MLSFVKLRQILASLTPLFKPLSAFAPHPRMGYPSTHGVSKACDLTEFNNSKSFASFEDGSKVT